MVKLSLKLLVDKEKNRVVLAESNGDFMDVLFSFLTLPLGTIIRLIGKKSSLGCFNSLYNSIQNLDSLLLETEACKNMLLQPRSAAEGYCENLKLNVNDLQPRRMYRCTDWQLHSTDNTCLYSSVPGARCSCGRTMKDSFNWSRITSKADGVFVNGETKRFIVTDDFQVMEACTAHSLALLINKLGIVDGANLEKRDVEVGQEEVLSLLERSLLSNTPLSEVFLGSKQQVTTHDNVKELKQIKVETDTSKVSNQLIELKLFVNKDNGEVLYAEAKDDFVNLLFSFLTFPLGSIVKLLDRQSSLGCIDNLYRSVADCTDNGVSIKPEKCKAMLLNPNLAPHFGCSNQMLKIDEMPPYNFNENWKLTNPKLQNSRTDGGGGFVKGPSRFMVNGELVVTPMSPLEVIDQMNKLQLPLTSLKERILYLAETEVLNFLKASLTSNNALNNAFSSTKRRTSWRHLA